MALVNESSMPSSILRPIRRAITKVLPSSGLSVYSGLNAIYSISIGYGIIITSITVVVHALLVDSRIVIEAKKMLRLTNMPLKAISLKLGFDDASNFVKFFKRIVGKTPLQYRAME